MEKFGGHQSTRRTAAMASLPDSGDAAMLGYRDNARGGSFASVERRYNNRAGTAREPNQEPVDDARRDGKSLPPRLKTELLRELIRLELVMSHLVDLEAERDRALQADQSPTLEVTQRPTAETASAGRSRRATAAPAGAISGSRWRFAVP
jgi:hypothetical protein